MKPRNAGVILCICSSARVLSGTCLHPGVRVTTAGRALWQWGEGERGRGARTDSLHSTLGRKRIILGSLGRNRPQGPVYKFSDSQAPWRHHSPATCSSSNGSAIAHSETRPQLPIWGGAERPGLFHNGHEVSLPHKTLYFFYFGLFKLYFLLPTVLFFVN